jgi:hypothetical protein
MREFIRLLASILHEPSFDVDGGFLLGGSRFVLEMGRPMARLSCRVGAGFHGSGGVQVLVGMGRCGWSAGVR